MRLWVGVENFAKIESAKINVDNYTLLVGPNNSGKTFLMQLVQGLNDKLVDLLDEEDIELLFVEESPGYRKYIMNASNIHLFMTRINRKLEHKKESIVRDIFGRDIAIQRLYIELSIDDDEAYEIDVLNSAGFTNGDVKVHINSRVFGFNKFFEGKDKNERIGTLSVVQGENVELRIIAFDIHNDRTYLLKTILKGILEKNSLFLPASRTGLMLLYRDFFANKTDNTVLYQLKNEKLIESKERYGGLTQPIYEFLRFLQTYTSDEDTTSLYEDELNFFENKLIEGHISVNKQGTFAYNANADQSSVPMYLASAMINEVAPMVLALTANKPYNRLIIDEVEASLHPQKQLELARFLNRLNNNKMSLLFSTHSDTFVSKMNNLYVLSEYIYGGGDKSILNSLNLEEEDLIKTGNLFVYEFIFQENGKSIVREIIPDKKSGYQFDLFTKSAMEVYEEANRIGAMH